MTIIRAGLQRKEEPVLRQDSERKLEHRQDLYRLWGRGGFLNRKSSKCKSKVWELKAVFIVTLVNQPSKGLTDRQKEHLKHQEDAKAQKEMKAMKREGC